MTMGSRPRTRDQHGQALVEFSLAFVVLAVLLMAVFDFGRGIYTYNGVSQAAREIARATGVHPGLVLGQSQQSLATTATQRGLVPGMQDPVFECVDIAGTATGHQPCESGDWVRVTISAPYAPVSLLGIGGSFNLSSSSRIRVP